MSTRLHRNFASIALSNLLAPCFSLALVLAISRIQGVETLGKYSLMMTVFVVGQTVAALGLQVVVTREVAKSPAGAGRYFMHASLLAMACMLPCAVVAALGLGEFMSDREVALALSLTVQVGTTSTVPPNSEWSDDQPFTHLFQNLGTDFGNLPNRANAGIAVVGALGAIAFHRYDTPLSNWVAKQPSASYPKIGSFAGDAITQGSLAIGTYAIGKLAHDDEAIHLGSDFIRGQLLNGIFTEALKFGVNRTRPTGSNHSFPSGHSSASFTTAAILQAHFGWAVGTAAYAGAGFIGWSRLRENQHFLTDVIVGSALGVISGHTVTMGHHHQRPFQVVPSRTPDGGPAVLVIWTGRPSDR